MKNLINWFKVKELPNWVVLIFMYDCLILGYGIPLAFSKLFNK